MKRSLISHCIILSPEPGLQMSMTWVLRFWWAELELILCGSFQARANPIAAWLVWSPRSLFRLVNEPGLASFTKRAEFELKFWKSPARTQQSSTRLVCIPTYSWSPDVIYYEYIQVIYAGFGQPCSLNSTTSKYTLNGRVVEGLPEWDVEISNNCACPTSLRQRQLQSFS